jgi:hypothetical protein
MLCNLLLTIRTSHRTSDHVLWTVKIQMWAKNRKQLCIGTEMNVLSKIKLTDRFVLRMQKTI